MATTTTTTAATTTGMLEDEEELAYAMQLSLSVYIKAHTAYIFRNSFFF